MFFIIIRKNKIKSKCAKLQFIEQMPIPKESVIANHPAEWCGNPQRYGVTFSAGFPLKLGDSHASVRTGSE